MRAILSGLVAGLLFGVGLGLGGMTDPRNVLGFLDFAGAWNPSLLFVMGGGVGVFAALFPLIRRRTGPLFAPAFDLPASRRIDGRLLGGSALFGIGWGLLGLCPGPAIVNAAVGGPKVLLFLGAMGAGMGLHAAMQKSRAARELLAPDA
jgi:uncharacterized membrane protein YedE/YeeE